MFRRRVRRVVRRRRSRYGAGARLRQISSETGIVVETHGVSGSVKRFAFVLTGQGLPDAEPDFQRYEQFRVRGISIKFERMAVPISTTGGSGVILHRVLPRIPFNDLDSKTLASSTPDTMRRNRTYRMRNLRYGYREFFKPCLYTNQTVNCGVVGSVRPLPVMNQPRLIEDPVGPTGLRITGPAELPVNPSAGTITVTRPYYGWIPTRAVDQTGGSMTTRYPQWNGPWFLLENKLGVPIQLYVTIKVYLQFKTKIAL